MGSDEIVKACIDKATEYRNVSKAVQDGTSTDRKGYENLYHECVPTRPAGL